GGSWFTCCHECRAQKDNVLQAKGEETAAAGGTVTLGCLYNTSSLSNYYLFWYKQDGNNSPKFILSHPVSRLSVKVNETLMTLQISSAAVTDSAVYYCAVQLTVTGNTKPLYKNLWSKDNRILHNIH
uniref:Ig-like domain-containing protein n=1 Tax=Oreochromis aureus TaxID=47969 RepID=A0AAZ1XWH4_OREAU